MAQRSNENPSISLNVHLAVPSTNNNANDGSHTPNTPEILNSIVNMQSDSMSTVGPFAGFAPTVNKQEVETPLQESKPDMHVS